MKNKENDIVKNKEKKSSEKIIFIVLAVIVVGLMLWFIINGSIINKIVINQRTNMSVGNFSYTIELENTTDNSKKVVNKIYYKDGIKMYVMQNNGRDLILWNNENTNEKIYLVPSILKATVEKDANKELNDIPYLIDEYTSRTMKLSSIITSDIVDGEECYKINNLGLKLWYSKSTGMIVKAINGAEEENATKFKNWQFDNLEDEDVTRPNLEEYEIASNK